jgi:replicative DNA helicase
MLQLPTERDENGEIESRIVRFDEDAQERMACYLEHIEPRLGPGGDLHDVNDWGGKLAGAVARTATLLCLAEQPDYSVQVEDRHVRSASKLAEFWIAHAKAAFGLMGVDEAVADAQHIVEWIKRRQQTSFSKRDVHQECRGRFKRAAELEEPLGLLEERGYVRRRPEIPREGPGRSPSPVFDVNPCLFKDTR